MSPALTNRHLVLLSRLAERPELAGNEPAIFADLVRDGLAESALSLPRDGALSGAKLTGRPTDKGVTLMRRWLGRRAVLPGGEGLTKEMSKALVVIRDAMRERGMAPSREELMARLGLRSKSGAQRLVVALEERGFVSRIPFRARALAVAEHVEDLG